MPAITLSREIHFRLTVGRAIELRRLNLLDVFDLPTMPEAVSKIIGDQTLIASILFEITDKSIPFDAFCELLASASQDELWEVLRDSIRPFFRSSLWPWINGLFAAVKDAHGVYASRMLDSLNENEPSDTGVMFSDLGMESGNWPGSSASILVPSVIENSTSWPSAANEPSGTEQAS